MRASNTSILTSRYFLTITYRCRGLTMAHYLIDCRNKNITEGLQLLEAILFLFGGMKGKCTVLIAH